MPSTGKYFKTVEEYDNFLDGLSYSYMSTGMQNVPVKVQVGRIAKFYVNKNFFTFFRNYINSKPIGSTFDFRIDNAPSVNYEYDGAIDRYSKAFARCGYITRVDKNFNSYVVNNHISEYVISSDFNSKAKVKLLQRGNKIKEVLDDNYKSGCVSD